MFGTRRSINSWLQITIALAFLSVGSLAWSTEAVKNVRVTVEIGRLEGGKTASTSSFALVTAANGSRAQLASGTRVPIPAPVTDPGESAEPPADAAAPVYQNVGALINLEAVMEGAQVRVKGNIEASLIDGNLDTGLLPQGHSSTPPTIGTLNQQVDVFLRAGKPLRVSVTPVQGGAAIFIDLKAEILD